jgi:Polysaccharide pyruvyl transferase
MRTMRIGLITTINSNIGDDFIRDGIAQVLRHVYSDVDVRFLAINKHEPFSVYPVWHPLRWLQPLDRLPRGKQVAATLKASASQALHRFGGTRLDRVDAIVHCGAPLMWPGCHRSVWASALWDQVVYRLAPRVPVLVLAAGSAYPWEDQPNAVKDPSDAAFLGRVLDACRLVTARDELVSQLAYGLGTMVPTIPCTAFLVGRRFAVPTGGDEEVVLFNYMPGGGHWSWGQGIDPEHWMVTARTVIDRLSRRHRIAFLCHDREEYEAAELLEAELPRFLPTSIESYFSLISRSKAAITNRIHGAVALASLGIPSISVGTDTRMSMLAPIGLSFKYVKEVDPEQLEDELEEIVSHRHEERERLISLRDTTWDRYTEAVAQATSP